MGRATTFATALGFFVACGDASTESVAERSAPPVGEGVEAQASHPAMGPQPQTDGLQGGAHEPVVMVGAGDIAACSSRHDEATARLLDAIAGPIFLMGDNAYETGADSEYTNCFAPSWGRHKARMRPSPGNHEYLSRKARPYFRYFGDAAGPEGKGYYSYDEGDWHVVSLNSNCGEIGGCGAGSPQLTWLRDDLAANKKKCTLAYWHHPRFSSGYHGNASYLKVLWETLYEFDADLVVNGHEHNYERFAPQDPDGNADPQRGLREIVVGTGGRDLRPMGGTVENSEVRNNDAYGVLKLTLADGSYAWEFVPAEGAKFHDSGEARCH